MRLIFIIMFVVKSGGLRESKRFSHPSGLHCVYPFCHCVVCFCFVFIVIFFIGFVIVNLSVGICGMSVICVTLNQVQFQEP